MEVTLISVGSLVILPAAINVETGGGLPPRLAPYEDWLWPLAAVFLIAGIAIEIRNRVGSSRRTFSVRRPDHPDNIRLALSQVNQYVQARRQQSMLGDTTITLEIEGQTGAVDEPDHLVRRVDALPTGLPVAEAFAQLSESMLILGAAGSGKTTLLLDLATELTGRATTMAEPTIPVVVNLAGWSRPQEEATRRSRFRLRRDNPPPQDFRTWVLAAIHDTFGIPETVGRTWLLDGRFILLFDGLDEVDEDSRQRCLEEINALQSQVRIPRVAVTSRTEEYHTIGRKLRLQGAVTIRPLTRSQVQTLLSGPVDDGLRDLLTTPLMVGILLNIAIDTGMAAQRLLDPSHAGLRRRMIFDVYVVELLAKRRSSQVDDPRRFLHALRILAAASRKAKSGVTVAGLTSESARKVLPDHAADRARRRLWPGSIATMVFVWCAVVGWRFSTAAAVLPLLVGYMILHDVTVKDAGPGPRLRPLAAAVLLTAIGAAGTTALMWVLMELALLLPYLIIAGVVIVAFLVASVTLWWAADKDWEVVPMIIPGAAVAYALLFGDTRTGLLAWSAGFASGLWLFALATASGQEEKNIRDVPSPPHSHARTWRYFAPATVGLVLVSTSWQTPFLMPVIGWGTGMLWAVPAALLLRGWLCRPYVWIALAAAGEPNPWSQSFLRDATDRGLLIRVGHEYWFTHLLLRDHLADCNSDRLADAVARRRTELRVTTSSPPRSI